MKHRLLSILVATCLALPGFSAIPYALNESFEEGIPSTWTQETLSGNNPWIWDTESTYPNGSYAGEHRVAFRNTTSETQGYVTRLITPAMDISGISSPQLTFAYAQLAWTGNNDTLKVYYRLSSTDNWVLLQSFEAATTGWVPVTIGLIGSSATYQLAFEGHDDLGRGIVLDDVRVLPESQCSDAPVGLTVAPGSTTADISWTRDMLRTYEVIVSNTAISDLDNYDTSSAVFHQSDINAKTVTATGLTAQSHYYVYLRSDCDDNESGHSAWASAVEFETSCEAIATFPWTEDFEKYTGYTSSSSAVSFAADCWVNEHIGGSGSDLFYVYSSTNGSNSTKQLCLPDMSSGTLTKLVLPVFAIDEAEGYAFSLDIYRNATSYAAEGIRVYASNSTNIDDATELAFISRNYSVANGAIPAESASGWYNYEVNIPLSGNVFIIIRGESQYGSATYMDNFKVRKLPDCRKLSVNVSNIETTSAVVNFNSVAVAQNYQVVVATEALTLSGDPTEAQLAKIVYNQSDITTSGVNVEGLTSATTYFVYARALCGGEEKGEWSSRESFVTACAAISAFPWLEGFENTDANTMPVCWNVIREGGSYPYVVANSSYTTYSHEGTKALTWGTSYSYSTEYKSWAVMPEMENVNTLEMTFYLKIASSYYVGDSLVVGVMTDPTDTTTFVEVAAFHPSSTSYQQQYVSFESYVGTGKYIAFVSIPVGQSSYSSKYYSPITIDDIKVRPVPTCDDVSGVKVKNVTNNSAKVIFSNTGAANYQVIVATESAADPETLDASKIVFNDATLTDTIAAVSGLTAQTTYYAYVRGVCGTEDKGEWASPVAFTTGCDPIIITKESPLFESFEDFEKGSSSSAAPQCWALLNANDGSYPYIYVNNSSAYVQDGSKSLYFQSSNLRYGYAILPAIADINDKQIEFFYKDENASSSGRLFIGYMTDITNEETFVQIAEFERSTTWAKGKASFFTIPVGDAATARIAFKYGGASNNYYLGIDSIVISNLPDCRDMGAVEIQSVKTHGATVRFPANGAPQYQIVMATESIDPTYVDSAAVPASIIYNEFVTSVSNVINNTAIPANADIYVYVRAYCSSEEQGKWSNEVSFHTLCEPFSVDAFGVEDFNNVERINCWSFGFSTVGTSSSYAYAKRDSSAAYGAYLRLSKENAGDTYSDGAYAITPELDIEDLTKYEVAFNAATTNNSNTKNLKRLLVGVMTNPSDANTMQTLKAFNLDYAADSTAAKSYVVSLADAVQDEDGNYPHYVFFMAAEPNATHDSVNYVLIDNVSFSLLSSCPQIIETSASNVTTDGARFAWEEVTGATYQVLLSEINSKQPDTLCASALALEVVNTNHKDFSGLSARTTYYAYVRAICGVGDTASWSNATAFTTLIGIPYLEPFSATTLSEGWSVYNSSSSASDSVNVANFSTTGTYKWQIVSSGAPTGMEGSIAQFTLSTTYTSVYTWLVSPTIDLTGHEDDFIELSFKMAAENLYSSGIIAVYVSVDGAQSFKKLGTIAASEVTSAASKFAYKLTKFAGKKINLAFYAYQYYSTYSQSGSPIVSLDSVSVHTYDAVCMGVENLQVALNGMAIDASWEIEGTPVKTIVELSDDANFATFIDSVVVEDALTHQFTGLQLSKTYYVRAKQADCANAEWVVSEAVKTPIGIPYSESFNVSSIPSDWTIMSGDPASAFAGTAPTSASGGWYISTSSNGLPANHAKINIWSSANNKWLVSPIIDMTSIQTTDSIVMSFDFAYTDYNSASGPDANSDQALLLLVSTDGGNTWTAANGYEWSHTDSIVANVSKTLSSIPTTGTTITLTDFARFAGNSIKIAFVATTTSGDNDFHVANVSLKQIIAGCDDPTELAVEGGSRQIAVTWNGDADKRSIIQWSKTSDFASLKADTIESGLSYTIESLDPATTYFVRVQQICAAGNTDFTAVQSAATDCETISEFPWNEDFSGFATGTLANPCWKNQHTVGTTTKLFSISGASLYLPDMQPGNRTLLSLPEMTISEADAFAFVLDVKRESSSKTQEGIVIYASQSDTIDASAVRLAHIIRAFDLGNDTVPAEAAAGWYNYEFTIPMSGTVRILIEGISEYGNSTYMDNFKVYRMPTCRQVKNVAVDSIGNDTVLVSFDTLKIGVPYEILVATAEIDFTKALTAADSAKIAIDDKTITASPAVIRGLVPGAHYYVYVRALCDEFEQGEWSNAASFRTIPTCEDMTAPKSVDKSDNSVTVAFTKTNAANYQLLATLAAINPDTLDNVADSIIAYNQVVSEDTVEISGLQPQTFYYIYVRGVCATEDKGAWSAVLSVKTACGAITTFPWKEDFDASTSLSECWNLVKDGNYPSVSSNSTYAHSGSNSFNWGTSYTSSDQYRGWLVLPEIDTAVNTFKLTMWARCGYSYSSYYYETADSVIIGVMDSQTDTASFVRVDAFMPTTTYAQYEIDLSSYAGSGKYITILRQPLGDRSGKAYSYNGYSYYSDYTYDYCLPTIIDDVELSFLPACRDLKGLAVKEISSSAAKASWKPTNAGQYQVILANAEITPSDVDSVSGIDAAKLVRIDTVAEALINYTALTPATDYYIYVRGLCDENEKSVWGSAEFKTECLVAVPYSMDFDDADDRKVAYVSYGTSYKIPSCFNAMAGGSGYPARVYDESEENTSSYTYSYAHSGTSSLRIYSSSTSPQFVTLPEMNQRTDTLALTFKARALYAYVSTSSGSKTVTNYASSSYAHALKIGTMTDPADTASFQLIETVVLNEITTTPSSESDDPAGNNYWETFTVYLTGATGKFIAFVSDFSSSNYVWIDDVQVDFMPDCRVPAQINITPANRTADIEWVGTADEYELAIGAQGFKLPAAADSIYVLDTTFLHVEELTGNTAYDVYIRSACGEGLYSAWSKVTTFRTDCDVYALPFSENFNALESGIPTCWDNSEGTTTTESYKWNYYASSTDTCARFNSYLNSSGNTNVLVTPLFYLEKEAYLTFDWKNPDGGEGVIYLTRNGVAKPDTLETKLKSISSWKQYSFDLTQYTGDTVAIHFKGTSNWGSNDAYLYLDNVKLNLWPDCRIISTLRVDSLGVNAAKLSWKATKAAQYQLVLANAAIDPSYVDSVSGIDASKLVRVDTVAATQCLFEELDAQTAYYAYIRGLCDVASKSDWSEAYSFTTDCDAVSSFPWSEDFNAYSDGNFSEGCWENKHIAGSSSYVYTVTTGANGNTSKVLKLPDMQTGNRTLLALPTMDIEEADSYGFRLDIYRDAYSTYNANEGIRVYAANNSQCDTLTATLLGFLPREWKATGINVPAESEAGWYTYEFELPFQGTTRIFLVGVSQYKAATNIDNFMVRQLPQCKNVKGLEVLDIAADTTVVSFANSGAAAYELVVADAAINPDSAATSDVAHVVLHNTALTDTAAIVRDLSASTQYFAYVRGLCGEDEHSEKWTSASFTTACGVISAFPWADDLENYAIGTFEGLCWTNERITGNNDLSITNTAVGVNATNMLYMKYQDVGSSTGGTTATAVATLPVFRIDSANAYGVSLDMYRAADTYGDIEGVRILASLSAVLDSSAVELGYICRHYDKAITGSVAAESAAGWYTYEFAIPLEGEVYIFVRTEQEYDANSIFMDNFRVRQLPTCDKVTGVEVSDITVSSATISFPSTGAANYHVIVASAALDLSKVLSATDSAKIAFDDATLTDTVANVTGLTANTLYYAYARGLCDNEDGEWSAGISFRTDCGVFTLPYSQNFDNTSERKQIDGTSYYLPVCWNEGHSSTSAMSRIYTNSESYYYSYLYAKSGTSALGVVSDASNASYAVLPLIETDGGNGIDLSFEARALYVTEEYDDYSWSSDEVINNYATSSYAHSVKVGLMSDPSDISTFSLVEEVKLTEIASTPSSVSDDPNGREYWENYTVRLEAPAGKYIAFVSDYSKTNRVWIDDIQAIEFNDACSGVNGIEVSNVSTSGLDVAFHYNEADDDNDARIAISASETLDLDNVLLLDTIYNDSAYSAVVTLASGSSFYVFVQQFCGDDGTSAWEKVEIHTPYMVRYEPVFSSTTLPSDWNRYTGLVDNVLDGTSQVTSTTSGWSLTAADAIINSTHFRGDIYGGSFNYWMVTPTIDLTPNVGEGLLLSFEAGLTPYSSSYVSVRNSGTDDRFAVLVTTDDGATWTKVAEWNNAGTGDYVYNDIPEDGAPYRLNLSNFAGQNVRIAFYGESTESNADNYLHFGNIVLDRCAARTYNDHICSGSDYDGSQAADPNPFYIAADQYKVGENVFSEFRPSEGAGDVDSMIVLNLYVHDWFTTDLNVTLCEGEHYNLDENGWEFDAVYGMADKRKILTSSLGCDSVVILHINVIQAVTVEISDSVRMGDAYHWNGQDYYLAGNYQFKTQSVITGCDSTTVLHLSVYQEEQAIHSVTAQSLLIAPNPVKIGEPIHVLTSFTAAELREAKVEIISAAGSLFYTQQGAEDPFVLPGIPVSGVYIVRVIIGDEIFISSLLVH